MAEFDENRIRRIAALAEKALEAEKNDWTAEAVFERIDSIIIGNTRYKRSLALCLSDFLGAAMIRNHLLVVGPSGTGKTYLLEQCLPAFSIPYIVIDGSSLVPSGYKGNTLQESLGEFFRVNVTASRRSIIVLDEFDKISERANGGDIHKSHSIQSELLTLIQGKNENSIDTRNAVWILVGAFAYTDEMKRVSPKISKSDLLKYGFKNELLGRITKLTMTDIPSVEDVVRRVARDRTICAFSVDLSAMGFTVEFQDEAILAIAMAAQNPNFGMRVIPSLVAELKEEIIFHHKKGQVLVSKEMVRNALER